MNNIIYHIKYFLREVFNKNTTVTLEVIDKKLTKKQLEAKDVIYLDAKSWEILVSVACNTNKTVSQVFEEGLIAYVKLREKETKVFNNTEKTLTKLKEGKVIKGGIGNPPTVARPTRYSKKEYSKEIERK